MKVRQLRKVHQYSMFAKLVTEYGAVGHGHTYAAPADAKVILPPVSSTFRVVRAKDGVEVAVLNSMEEVNALIEKHVKAKKAKLVLASELETSVA